MSKKIGIFGGSFDPVHYGHLIVAEQCREQAQLDSVVFIPANQSPLKSHGPIASARHRLEMLKLATTGNFSFFVDTIELDRPGLSFTIDTLRELHNRGTQDLFYFVVGSDALKDFAKWREPAEILRLAAPLLVARPGEVAALEVVRPFVSPARWHEIQHGRIESPLLEVSSSDIRRRVGSNRSIRYMTPRAVEVYIETNGLYKDGLSVES